jgi:hypothetical protein
MEGTPIGRWKVDNFVILQRKADHSPLHVHVFRSDDEIGRYDLEHNRWMEGPYDAEAQANRAVARWKREHGF